LGVLDITGGTMIVTQSVWIGNLVGAQPCYVNVKGGVFAVTNGTGTAYIDDAHGALTLNGGQIITDNLILTNGGNFTNISGILQFTRQFQVESNGSFVVAGGTNVASTNFIAGSNSGSTGTVAVTSGGLLNATNGVFGLGNGG